MEMQFYVYGVPDGFDLYEGKSVDIAYFQSYYDGSKETSKLTLHRRDEHVVYSYLRYNLISSKGRPGAFFGISIVFNAMYCTDVINLYKLFDLLYDTILQNAVLLKKTSKDQIIFGVSALKDASTEIRRIENILKKNINSQFSNDFQSTDNSFKRDQNRNVLIKLGIDNGNKSILSVWKEYPIISVSPEYEGAKSGVGIVSPEQLLPFSMAASSVESELSYLKTEFDKFNMLFNLHSAITNKQDRLKTEIEIVRKYIELDRNIKGLLKKCANEKKNIQVYLQRQKEHPLMLDLNQKFIDGENVLIKLDESLKIIAPGVEKFDKNTEMSKAYNLPDLLMSHKLIFAIILVVIICIILAVIMIFPKQVSTANNHSTSAVIEEIKKYIEESNDLIYDIQDIEFIDLNIVKNKRNSSNDELKNKFEEMKNKFEEMKIKIRVIKENNDSIYSVINSLYILN
jgi:hypothetical protein